uniref:Uncharacterized protein n=1 Tax=Anguilla anguilla TaxID=7936 RepID=A0A0E9PJ30_ANGAN
MFVQTAHFRASGSLSLLHHLFSKASNPAEACIRSRGLHPPYIRGRKGCIGRKSIHGFGNGSLSPAVAWSGCVLTA